MNKFIILYQERLHGAVIGTESGNLSSITKQQLQNESWIEEHTSSELKVVKITDKNTFSSPGSSTDFLIDKDIGSIESDLVLEFKRVKTKYFEVAFSACFSKKKNLWLIEGNPLILPL